MRDEPLIFEIGSPGRRAVSLPADDLPPEVEPPALEPELAVPALEGLPELSELEVVRHFTRLSQWNFSIASNFYPLGSCTMKYNPIVNEWAARLAGHQQVHPLWPDSLVQGALALLFELERMLAEVSGMDAVTLTPAAGAQGEFVSSRRCGRTTSRTATRARRCSSRRARTAPIRRARCSAATGASRCRSAATV